MSWRRRGRPCGPGPDPRHCHHRPGSGPAAPCCLADLSPRCSGWSPTRSIANRTFHPPCWWKTLQEIEIFLFCQNYNMAAGSKDETGLTDCEVIICSPDLTDCGPHWPGSCAELVYADRIIIMSEIEIITNVS